MIYDLADLSSTNGANIGGICKLKFAPKEWVDSFPLRSVDDAQASSALTFLSGLDWLNLKPLNDSLSYDEEQKDSEAGTFFMQKMSAIINKDDALKLAQVDAFRFYEFVCLLQDRNGHWKLLGSKEKGISTSVKLVIGNEFKDKSYYSLTFSHESEHMAMHYPF